MGKIVNRAVLDEIKSLYPLLNIHTVTSQQETLLILTLQGSPLPAAARGAGYKSPAKAREFLHSPNAVAILKYFAQQEMAKIAVNRDMLTKMSLECYNERSNASEGLKAVEVLARLHGQNEEARQTKVETNVTVNQQTVNAGMDTRTLKKKMGAMDDEQLLEFVGEGMAGLELEPVPLCEEVAKDKEP